MSMTGRDGKAESCCSCLFLASSAPLLRVEGSLYRNGKQPALILISSVNPAAGRIHLVKTFLRLFLGGEVDFVFFFLFKI